MRKSKPVGVGQRRFAKTVPSLHTRPPAATHHPHWLAFLMSSSQGSTTSDQMMEMWNKVKSGANAAANQLEMAAEKAKLQAEITYLQNRIKGTKKDMGLQIYDAMAIGDQNEVARVFGTFKSQVDGFEAQISEKRGRIEVLDLQRG